MRQFLPPLRLVGAEVLRDGEMQSRSVAIDAGRITKGPHPEVDLSGYLVLPGIIDLEAAAPLQTVTGEQSFENGWIGLDRTASGSGVTTAVSRQAWSWTQGTGDPAYAGRSAEALRALRQSLGTDLRMQMHVETHLTDSAEELKAQADGTTVTQVIFSNRLTQTLSQAEIDRSELRRQAAMAGEQPDVYLARLRALSKRSRDVPRFLCGLAEAFDQAGVIYGSQGDPDGETREFYSMIGARLCLRPHARTAAALARAVGDPVLLSACSLLDPLEHRGEYAVADLILRGQCTALVSDGSFDAMASAAFALAERGLLTLPQVWSLISQAPAEIARMPDRGRIDYGLRADLVVVNAGTRRIEATISNGRLTYLTGEAANRFMGAPTAFGHAAE